MVDTSLTKDHIANLRMNLLVNLELDLLSKGRNIN
jgi:hypothetical protein